MTFFGTQSDRAAWVHGRRRFLERTTAGLGAAALGRLFWMSGGGMRVGHSIGETVEFGLEIARDPIHVNDSQTTILCRLGFDREILAYEHAGRKFRLADVQGHVVRKLMRAYRDRRESRIRSPQQVRHGSIHE